MAASPDLVAKFAALGLSDPEGWAASQEREGIPQLTRATVLAALSDIVASAARGALSEKAPPGDALSETLNRLRASGIAGDDLERVFRFVAALAIFDVCTLLDGAREIDDNPDGVLVSLAISHDDPMGEDDPTFEAEDLALHESLGQVVTDRLGPGVYWN